MKIDLFDMDEFIELNHLEEVTSPTLADRGGVPNPRGLVSNEIFGTNIKARKNTFAYIDLVTHFIHPHIYKIIKRVFRNIDKIVNGEYYYVINKGELIRDDENGETGIEFLYDNWEKIKWGGGSGISKERTDLISKTPKNVVWLNKFIVIPAFYRDINSKSSGGGESAEINNLYNHLIRGAAMIRERDMFDIEFYSTEYNMQNTLIAIYDLLKAKLEKKSGLLRKYLLGKNTDYAVRSVISCPIYKEEHPEDNIVDFDHAALPLAQAAVECYPFVVAWLRNFFDKEIIENQHTVIGGADGQDNLDATFIALKNPEAYFNDTYIEKAIDRYVRDTSSRFDTILVPTKDGKEHYLMIQGYMGGNHEAGHMLHRRMTWTDLLYMACDEICANKHVMITRYPINDAFGIFVNKIHLSSTLRTAPMEINGKIYKWYPVIDLTMPKSKVANNFIDTVRFSNSYLVGNGGD